MSSTSGAGPGPTDENPTDRNRAGNSQPDRICVGQFAGSHGVRGLVKLRSFTGDPEAVASYGPLSDERGTRVFRVSLQGTAKDLFLAQTTVKTHIRRLYEKLGVSDRGAAVAYAMRNQLLE